MTPVIRFTANDGGEVTLPARFVQCPLCSGKGCDECGGQLLVVVDEELADPELVDEYYEQQADEWAYRQEAREQSA